MEGLNLVDEINALAVKMQQKELEAVDHDQKAIHCRAEKAEFRRQYSELNSHINDVKVVHVMREIIMVAKKAQERAEEAAKQVEDLVKELKKDKPEETNGN